MLLSQLNKTSAPGIRNVAFPVILFPPPRPAQPQAPKISIRSHPVSQGGPQ